MESQVQLQIAMDQAEVNSPEWWDLWAQITLVKGKMRDKSEDYEEIAKQFGGFPVIEIGCGFGALSDYLPADMDYLGVDISPFAIQQARRLRPDRTFTFGDIHALPPHHRARWASAVALQVIEHEKYPLQLMRVLRDIATRSAVITVPRGIASEHQRDVDGHVSEWADEDAFVEQFKQFGRVKFFRGVEHHICAEITWAN